PLQAVIYLKLCSPRRRKRPRGDRRLTTFGVNQCCIIPGSFESGERSGDEAARGLLQRLARTGFKGRDSARPPAPAHTIPSCLAFATAAVRLRTLSFRKILCKCP